MENATGRCGLSARCRAVTRGVATATAVEAGCQVHLRHADIEGNHPWIAKIHGRLTSDIRFGQLGRGGDGLFTALDPSGACEIVLVCLKRHPSKQLQLDDWRFEQDDWCVSRVRYSVTLRKHVLLTCTAYIGGFKKILPTYWARCSPLRQL